MLTVLIGGLLVFNLASLFSGRRQLLAARADLQSASQAVATGQDEVAGAALDRAESQLLSARGKARRLPLRVLGSVPVLGSPVRAMSDAARAGLEGVAAGRAVVRAAASFPTSGAAVLDGQDLSAFHTAAVRSQTELTRAESHAREAYQALQGPANAVLPPVSRAARAMRAELERNRRQLDGARRALILLADLTAKGSEARLLVLSQDTLELRPTGGYIGSYGVLHLAAGTVRLEKYEATDQLPVPDPPMEPPEELKRVLPAHWGLSNVNWWPNFPTTASTAREMFRRQGGGEVDGVVALTEHALSRLIGALGSVQVPGYIKPVVEEGFAERAVYEVELKRPQDMPVKRFLIELAKIVFAQVFNPPPDRFAALVSAVDRSVGAGDIQLWFAEPSRQALIDEAVIAGRLRLDSNQDFLMLVDANVTASKANARLSKQATYRVRRERDGSLRAQLEVRVTNDGLETPINPYYNGYLRLFVPPGARLLNPGPDQGLKAPDDRDRPFEVFAQLLRVDPKAEQVVTFDYRLPPDVAPNGRYRLTWIRQVGTGRDSLTTLTGGVRQVPGDSRSLEVVSELRGNRVMEWLRSRWVLERLLSVIGD